MRNTGAPSVLSLCPNTLTSWTISFTKTCAVDELFALTFYWLFMVYGSRHGTHYMWIFSPTFAFKFHKSTVDVEMIERKRYWFHLFAHHGQNILVYHGAEAKHIWTWNSSWAVASWCAIDVPTSSNRSTSVFWIHDGIVRLRCHAKRYVRNDGEETTPLYATNEPVYWSCEICFRKMCGHIERSYDKLRRANSTHGFPGTRGDPVRYHYWLANYDSASCSPGVLPHGTQDPLGRRLRN